MSATDELRRLLDERGVVHSDHYLSTTWRGEHGILHLAGEPMADGSLVVDMLTPEQAIAATLSGGECELTYGETDKGVDSWFTQCGGRFTATFEDGRMVHPKFCQLCGRKAVER